MVIVLAERDGVASSVFEGLPEVRLRGLSEEDAVVLVSSVALGPLDESVRGRIIAEARGNPLALLEFPRERSSAALAGGFAVPNRLPLPNRIQDSYRRRVAGLPEATQQLLLLAAADPVGDPNLLWRAASELGIPVAAAVPAEADELLHINGHVGFRHPLLRSAIYQGASSGDRRNVHQALASHRSGDGPRSSRLAPAQAVLGPNDIVAAELERRPAGRRREAALPQPRHSFSARSL